MSPLFSNPFASTSSPPPNVSPLPLPTSCSRRRSSLIRTSSSSTSTTIEHNNSRTEPGQVATGGSGGNGSKAGGSGPQLNNSTNGISFTSPFQGPGKRVSISQASTSPRRRKSQSEPGQPTRSASQTRRTSRVVSDLPASPRSSNPASPATPMRSPSVSSASGTSFFSNYLAPTTPQASTSLLNPNNVDFTRRRSVDVGVLGVGTHRVHGVTAMSKKVRDAVGPDAGDKETGVIGAGKKGGRDRL